MTSWIDQSRLNDALKAIEPIQKIVFEEKRFQSIRGVKLEDIYDKQYVLLAKQALLRLTANITELKAVDAELAKLKIAEIEALKRADALPTNTQNTSVDTTPEKHYTDIQTSGPISDIPLQDFLCKDAQGDFIYDDKIENREPRINPRVREQFDKTKDALQKLLYLRSTSKNIKEHLEQLQPLFFKLELFLMAFTANVEKALLNAKLLHAKNQLDTVLPDLALKSSQLEKLNKNLEHLQAAEIRLSSEVKQQANQIATLEQDNIILSEERNTLSAEAKQLKTEKNQIEGDYKAYERNFDIENLDKHALKRKIDFHETRMQTFIAPIVRNQWLQWTTISLIALVSLGLLTTGIMALAGAPLLPGLGLIYGISTTVAGSLLAYFASEAYLKECEQSNNLTLIEEAVEDLSSAAAENKAENEHDNDNQFHAEQNPVENFAVLKDFVYVNEESTQNNEKSYSPLSYFGYLGSLFATSSKQAKEENTAQLSGAVSPTPVRNEL